MAPEHTPALPRPSISALDARSALRRAEPILRAAVLGSALWSLLRTKADLQLAAGELDGVVPTIGDAASAKGSPHCS